MNKIIVEETNEVTGEAMVDKIVEEKIETITEITEVGTGLGKGHLPEAFLIIIEIEVQGTVGPGQDPEQVQTEIGYDVISIGNTIIS